MLLTSEDRHKTTWRHYAMDAGSERFTGGRAKQKRECTCVPVKESLAPEHSCELLADTLEHLLDGSGVAHKGGSHLEALGGDVTDGRLDVVGDPLHKVGGVLVLDIKHLLIHLRDTIQVSERKPYESHVPPSDCTILDYSRPVAVDLLLLHTAPGCSLVG